ncbi:hypothetical protein [Streptomyces canus]|nr:hypothetical protein [Streptomyces canus]WSD82933.1 hypothetical protein OG925_00510 [Streptomyces canus]WSD91902.1 hypothetical protein OG925_49970 [Streptomyces canus]WSD92609.1 hypothetical protein OG925_50990 [Streptomyces canus]
MAETTRGIPASSDRDSQWKPADWTPDTRHETVYDPERGGNYPPEKNGKK